MCNDNFGMLLATGIATMFTFEVLVNVGMTIGIMPVTGIPLPFLSYGVSALTTNMLSIGILLNIAMQRTKYIFKYPIYRIDCERSLSEKTEDV